MRWQDVLGEDAEPPPLEDCDRCEGTGLVGPDGKSADQFTPNHRTCWDCHGAGMGYVI